MNQLTHAGIRVKSANKIWQARHETKDHMRKYNHIHLNLNAFLLSNPSEFI